MTKTVDEDLLSGNDRSSRLSLECTSFNLQKSKIHLCGQNPERSALTGMLALRINSKPHYIMRIWQPVMQLTTGRQYIPVGRPESRAFSSDRNTGIGGQLQAELPVSTGRLQVAQSIRPMPMAPLTSTTSRHIIPDIPAGSPVHAHSLEGAGIHSMGGLAVLFCAGRGCVKVAGG